MNKNKKTKSKKEEQVDDAKALFGKELNAKRLRAALATPREEHIVFESLKDLENALGLNKETKETLVKNTKTLQKFHSTKELLKDLKA